MPSDKLNSASARADIAGQLGIDDCLASARADSVAEALAEVEEARDRYRLACEQRNEAEAVLNDRVHKARLAGATVRATAAAAGMGKTAAHEIMRYGERGWR